METKTCKKCGKTYPATNEYFHWHYAPKNGRPGLLRARCKKCKRTDKDKRGLAKPRHFTDKEKACSQCGKIYPATTEYWHKKGKGLKSACKTCRNKNNKDYRNRTKLSSRTCKVCGKTKPLTNEYWPYHNISKSQYRYVCRKCSKGRMDAAISALRRRQIAIKANKRVRARRIYVDRIGDPVNGWVVPVRPDPNPYKDLDAKDHVRLARCKSEWHRMILETSFKLRDEENGQI